MDSPQAAPEQTVRQLVLLSLLGLTLGTAGSYFLAPDNPTQAHVVYLAPLVGLTFPPAFAAWLRSYRRRLRRAHTSWLPSLGLWVYVTAVLSVWSYAYGANFQDDWRPEALMVVQSLAGHAAAYHEEGVAVNRLGPDAPAIDLTASYPNRSVEDVQGLLVSAAEEERLPMRCERGPSVPDRLQICHFRSESVLGRAMIERENEREVKLVLHFERLDYRTPVQSMPARR